MPIFLANKISITRNSQHAKSVGFTLVETLLATAILTISIVGSLSLFVQSTSLSGSIRNEHIAANLAQEGVEFVHNIRNTNWVVDRVWDTGLSDGAFMADPLASPVALTSVACGSDSTNLFQKNNLYIHDSSGSPTIFSRCITLASVVDADTSANGERYILVQSTVTWNGGQVTAEDHLYNWK